MGRALVIHERRAARDLRVDLRGVLGIAGLARATSGNRLILEVPLVLDLVLPDFELKLERLRVGLACEFDLRQSRAAPQVIPLLAGDRLLAG